MLLLINNNIVQSILNVIITSKKSSKNMAYLVYHPWSKFSNCLKNILYSFFLLNLGFSQESHTSLMSLPLIVCVCVFYVVCLS